MSCRLRLRQLETALVLLASLSTAVRSSAEEVSAEGKTIRKVTFAGIDAGRRDAVQIQIQTRPGKQYTTETANADIKRLIRAGYFCKEYTARVVGGQVEVEFAITPEPLIDSIEFTGSLKRSHSKKYKDLIQARKGDLLRRHQINADKQAILLELKAKGYHFAKVDHEILPGPAGGATVRFNVDPGKRVRVKSVALNGTSSISRRKLLKVMKTKIDHWYNSGKYIQDNFEEDVKIVREFYRLKGWLDADATINSVEFTKSKKQVMLGIDVKEGSRYQLESVSFEGNELFTTEQLRSITSLRGGAGYSPEDLQRDLKKIRDTYGEKGYVRSEIKADPIVLQDGNKVRLKYTIVEGEKAYVEAINVLGNTRTKDIVIRREIDLVPGEEFNTVKLDGSLRRLRNLGYFEAVEAGYAPGSEANLSTVNIRVKEGKTGVFRVGAGFSSNDSFIGSIAVTQRNFDYKDLPKSWHDFLVGNAFVGDGQTLSLNAQPGTVVNRYQIAFTEPYLFDRPVLFGLSGFHFDRDRGVYDETRSGASTRLGKRLIPDLSVESSYRFERVKLNDIDVLNAPIAVTAASGRTDISSVTLRLSYDKRDDYFFPSKGHRSDLSYELAGTAFGGDVDLQKVILGHSRYFTLWRTKEENPHVVSVQARSGWQDNIGSAPIPIFERFFLGGANTVRGFDFRTLGPQERNEPVGGEFFYQLNSEYRFPVFGKVFQTVLFNDIGNVTPYLGNGKEFSTWRASAGFGLRIRVPALGPIPITMDFAFPWRTIDGDDEEMFSFQFGTLF